MISTCRLSLVVVLLTVAIAQQSIADGGVACDCELPQSSKGTKDIQHFAPLSLCGKNSCRHYCVALAARGVFTGFTTKFSIKNSIIRSARSPEWP